MYTNIQYTVTHIYDYRMFRYVNMYLNNIDHTPELFPHIHQNRNTYAHVDIGTRTFVTKHTCIWPHMYVHTSENIHICILPGIQKS
jgi:hypothetical protein